MPSTPPDTPGLEALVGRLDLQPWLTRRGLVRNRELGLGSPFLRGLGLPAVLHLPVTFVYGGIALLVAGHSAQPSIDALVFVVFPVLEALACVLLAVAFQRRRSAKSLTHPMRAQYRFLGVVLTLLSAFGNGASFFVPLVVSAVALASTYVPTAVPERTDGKPWWYDA